MAKKPEKDQENDEVFVFESDFDVSKIKESAKMDIKPKFEIEGLGIEFSKNVIIKGSYYNIEIPIEKSIDGKTTVKAINFIYNGVEHQFICEAGSFRYQLDVIRFRRKLNIDNIDGLKLKIWKQIATIDSEKFKGKAPVYCLKEL